MNASTDEPKWKGIVLAGGKGTRLYPLTLAFSKQLLPVYDKPMIYYPISTLILGGIRDILVISTPRDLPRFRDLLGDGSQLGLHFSYAEQREANGIAQAFLLGKEFIDSSPVCLILGDNLFHGDASFLTEALGQEDGATVFGYPVSHPERYGVVEFGPDGDVVDIEEKPASPRSNYVVPGLYCYDNRVSEIAASLQPSGRGELEITDLNKEYLRLNQLRVSKLGEGIAWLDMGSPETLLEAASFVETLEHRQGVKLGCIEESAFRMGLISRSELASLAVPLKDTAYGQHLLAVSKGSK